MPPQDSPASNRSRHHCSRISPGSGWRDAIADAGDLGVEGIERQQRAALVLGRIERRKIAVGIGRRGRLRMTSRRIAIVSRRR